jgi:HEAT repeat protein
VTQTSPNPETSSAVGAPDEGDLAALPLAEIGSLFVVLSKALRAHQLYDENNPVYQRFLSQLAEALRGLWRDMDRLHVHVEEDRLSWMGEQVYQSSSRTDSLAFLLYKDGIRDFTFLKGLEDHELPDLLMVLNRARDLRPEGDDLLTVLWEKDLQYFTYSYIDLLAEGIDLPFAGEGYGGPFQDIIKAELEVGQEDLEALLDGSDRSRETGMGAGVVSAEDFNPTLYSLDPLELQRVQGEIELEMKRDLRGDVLAALFDRVEEPRFPRRQREVLEVFRTLLPSFLSRGALWAAGSIVEEIARLRAAETALAPDERALADEILDELSGSASIGELVQALEDGTIAPDPVELASLLRHLRAGALKPLLRGAEGAEDRRIKGVIQEAVRSIGGRSFEALMDCLASDDPVVIVGACSLAGKLKLAEAAPLVANLIQHESPAVRLAAVDAAVDMKASTAAGALQDALTDPDRAVRIAAARGLGTLRYRPSAQAFREVMDGKAIRSADVSEQIAFFESYGLIQDPEGVRFLDGLLNGRGFLGRRESGEIRACAALGLGKIGGPEAMAALEKARGEQDPVVRSAVNRALRGEG